MGAGESKEEKKEATASEAASTALAVGAFVGLAGGAIYALLASGSSNSVSNENEKMMKAPGQNGVTIRRTDFEENPKTYFSDLRKGKGNSNRDGDKIAKGPWMKAPEKIGVTIPRDDFEDNPKGYFSDLRKGK